MAYYSYKRSRDILIQAGHLTDSGDPVDTKRYGEVLTVDYDGNLWDIMSDYTEELRGRISHFEFYYG